MEGSRRASRFEFLSDTTQTTNEPGRLISVRNINRPSTRRHRRIWFDRCWRNPAVRVATAPGFTVVIVPEPCNGAGGPNVIQLQRSPDGPPPSRATRSIILECDRCRFDHLIQFWPDGAITVDRASPASSAPNDDTDVPF